jgi:hypothetical protein
MHKARDAAGLSAFTPQTLLALGANDCKAAATTTTQHGNFVGNQSWLHPRAPVASDLPTTSLAQGNQMNAP